MKIVKKRPLMSEMKLIDSEAFFGTPYGHVNSCRSHNIRLILRHWKFFNKLQALITAVGDTFIHRYGRVGCFATAFCSV
jgi:hypothetical protein